MYKTIKKLLVERLPKLRELTMWCKYRYWDMILTYSHANNDFSVFVDEHGRTFWLDIVSIPDTIGHDPSHADLLRVLGDNWAMDGAYYLFNHVLKWRPDFPDPILLPEDLKELDNSEWKETGERLISLITK